MNPKWKSCLLGDVLTLQRGFDITKKEQKQGPVPVISSSGINSYHDTAKVKGPGVIIGRKGSLGTVFYVGEGYWPHDTTLWVKDFHGNSPKFTYYFLGTLNLANFDVGASNPTLNRNHIHLLPIRWPSLIAQHKIATILSTYDDLIENNTRRIVILEEMAQAIYQEWFVHFRYLGYEKNKIVESEVGKKPESWSIEKLSKLVSTQYGYTESASEIEIGPKFLRGMDINKTSYIQWDLVPYCTIDENDYIKYKLVVGDIIIIRMADPGKVGIVEKEIDAIFASYLIRLQITQPSISSYYLLYFLNSEKYQNYITGASTGTTRKSASAGVITDVNLTIPSKDVLESFEKKISLLRNMLNNLLNKNANLRHTRDMLLPKLISGEIDVEALDIKIPEVIEPEEQQAISIVTQPESIDATQLALPLS